MLAENFSEKSNLDDSGISFPAFLSRTNMNLHNISVTLKLVQNAITKLELSKASEPDRIPVVILKNCEPELSYILAELINLCLKESCFSDCWKVLSVVPVTLLVVSSKIFAKLVNNGWTCRSCREMWSDFRFPAWFRVFLINCRPSDSCIWYKFKGF